MGHEEGEESSRPFWKEPSRASGSSFQLFLQTPSQPGARPTPRRQQSRGAHRHGFGQATERAERAAVEMVIRGLVWLQLGALLEVVERLVVLSLHAHAHGAAQWPAASSFACHRAAQSDIRSTLLLTAAQGCDTVGSVVVAASASETVPVQSHTRSTHSEAGSAPVTCVCVCVCVLHRAHGRGVGHSWDTDQLLVAHAAAMEVAAVRGRRRAAHVQLLHTPANVARVDLLLRSHPRGARIPDEGTACGRRDAAATNHACVRTRASLKHLAVSFARSLALRFMTRGSGRPSGLTCCAPRANRSGAAAACR